MVACICCFYTQGKAEPRRGEHTTRMKVKLPSLWPRSQGVMSESGGMSSSTSIDGILPSDVTSSTNLHHLKDPLPYSKHFQWGAMPSICESFERQLSSHLYLSPPPLEDIVGFGWLCALSLSGRCPLHPGLGAINAKLTKSRKLTSLKHFSSAFISPPYPNQEWLFILWPR